MKTVQSKYKQLLDPFVKSPFIEVLLQTAAGICLQTAAPSYSFFSGNTEVRTKSSLFNSPPYYPQTSISLLGSLHNTQLVSLHYLSVLTSTAIKAVCDVMSVLLRQDLESKVFLKLG